MNSIESGTPSTNGFDGSVMPSAAASVGVADSAFLSGSSAGVMSAPAVTTASSVSPALHACRCGNTMGPSGYNNNPFALMSQVMDALVGLMTALMNMMKNLMGNCYGGPTGINAGSGGAQGTGNVSGAGNSGSTGSAAGAGNAGNVGGSGSSVAQPPTTGSGTGTTEVRSALDVNKNDAGMITVRTLDGYTIRAEGRDQAWTITGPDGKTTRIWGDPHVSESDGDKWDFLNRSTFMFGKNKVTVEVVPAGNGQTLSARITIYSDKERVTIDGIDKNQPTITAASSDGLQHDASLADGDIYKRMMTPTGEAWVSASTGQIVPVTR